MIPLLLHRWLGEFSAHVDCTLKCSTAQDVPYFLNSVTVNNLGHPEIVNGGWRSNSSVRCFSFTEPWKRVFCQNPLILQEAVSLPPSVWEKLKGSWLLAGDWSVCGSAVFDHLQTLAPSSPFSTGMRIGSKSQIPLKWPLWVTSDPSVYDWSDLHGSSKISGWGNSHFFVFNKIAMCT